MRFSELNKIKAEPAPEQKKSARPAPMPEPPKEKQEPEPAAERPQAVSDDAGNGTADKPAGVRKPKVRAEAGTAPKVPEPPFQELDSRARELYGRVLGQAGELLRGVEQPYTEKYEAVLRTCDLVIATLKTNNLLLNYACYSTAEDYLRAHSANVAIIALSMGLEAKLEAQELRLLGFCAMAHDIGMADYGALYSSESRLNEEDFAAITRHAEAGMAKLDRIVDLDYKIKDRAGRVILQAHERADGSGYPDGARDEEIDPLAQLIGIADVYEAMTHPRAWREAINPPDVIKELIEKEGRNFNSRAVKALVSSISIYPPDSLVILSTGEVARVSRINKGSLTRPLVEVLLDPEFFPAERRTIDLLEHPMTTIERPADLAELHDRNPKLTAKLQLERWWVDW